MFMQKPYWLCNIIVVVAGDSKQNQEKPLYLDSCSWGDAYES